MLNFTSRTNFYICSIPTDMRNGREGLTTIVREYFHRNLLEDKPDKYKVEYIHAVLSLEKKLESQNEDVEVSPDFLTFLDKTLKRCRLKGCDVRFCISPVYLKKSVLTRHAEESISRIADINDVRCMNYHSDSEFMVDSTLFKDAHHLNDCGVKKFTRIICGLN